MNKIKSPQGTAIPLEDNLKSQVNSNTIRTNKQVRSGGKRNVMV